MREGDKGKEKERQRLTEINRERDIHRDLETWTESTMYCDRKSLFYFNIKSTFKCEIVMKISNYIYQIHVN